MIKSIAEKPRTEKIEIDLTDPDGNAFNLLALARGFANNLGLDPEPILKEMRSGDYENLVQTFDRYFGDFVILYR